MKTKLEILGIALAAILLFAGLKAYVDNEKAIAAKDAVIGEVSKQNVTLKSDIGTLRDDIRSVQSNLARQESDFAKRQAAIQKSPTEAASIVSDKLGVKVDSKLPDAPSAVLTTADIQRLASRELTCELCSSQLAASQEVATKDEAIIEDQKKQLAGKDDAIGSLQKAVKGGSWIKRASKAVEYVAIGAAVGYAAGKVVK
jgi:hypothetical protein